MQRVYRNIFRFTAIFIALLGMHLFVLEWLNYPLFYDRILLSYLINFALAIALYYMLFKYKDTYREQLGFLFMAGSLFKFALFFIFFYPSYQKDNQITTYEFAAFYLPYAVSLIFETYGVINFLKK